MDAETIDNLAESLSFGEIREKILHTRFCSVLWDTVSDKDTLLNGGGILFQWDMCPSFLP